MTQNNPLLNWEMEIPFGSIYSCYRSCIFEVYSDYLWIVGREEQKFSEINARKYRRGNHKWIIQRNWQHWVHKTREKKNHNKKPQHWIRIYSRMAYSVSF